MNIPKAGFYLVRNGVLISTSIKVSVQNKFFTGKNALYWFLQFKYQKSVLPRYPERSHLRIEHPP